MQVRELPFEFAPDKGKRSPGLHLSDLVRAVERDIFGAEARPDKTPDQIKRLEALFEAGAVWERAIEIAYTERYTKGRPWVKTQRELRMDGVWLTPDADDTREKRVEEYKWTRVSTATIAREGFEKKWPGYLMQMKAYCRALGYTKALLVVLHVNGNYKYGTAEGEPTPKRYEFTFTKQEVKENWLLLMNKKREIEGRLKGKGAGNAGVLDGLRLRRTGAVGGGDPAGGLGRPRGEGRGGEAAGRGGAGAEAQVEAVPWLNFAALDQDREEED